MTECEEVTFATALAGRGNWLATIGFGSVGIGEIFAKRPMFAVPCLLLALAFMGRRAAASRHR